MVLKFKGVYRNQSRNNQLYQRGKLVCNWDAANHITKLEVQLEDLTKRISCNPEAHGLIKFNTLTPCGCLAAELYLRDSEIFDLKKEVEVLRKQKLLRSKK